MAMDLNAQVDEDEATARAAVDSGVRSKCAEWTTVRDGNGYVVGDEAGHFAFCLVGAAKYARHVTLHDPARELREVAFKRALLALHQPQPFYGNNPPPARDQTPGNAVAWYCECQCPDGVIEGEYPCETVRLLTAVYEP